jgi:hypothetical protein
MFDFEMRWYGDGPHRSLPRDAWVKRKADTVSLLRASESVLQISALFSVLVPPRSDGI